MKKTFNYIFLLSLGFTLLLQSCDQDELLEPTLAQSKSFESGIASDEDVYGILLGAYDRLSQSSYYGRDYIIYGELRSDNCFSNGNSGRFTSVSSMVMTADDGYARDTWSQIYAVIANANIIIAQNTDELEGDKDKIKHYIGQAYVIRALAHFDLLKLYGQQHVTGGNDLGIPYITEYKGENLYPKRNTVAEVKQMLYDDLTKAESLLSADLDDPSREFITSDAAYALESRIALYFGDWQKAKDAAERVINSGKYTIASADNYAATFTAKSTSNVIFEIAGRPTDNRGINGLSYIYRGDSYGDIQVVSDFINIFDNGDVRAQLLGYEGSKLRNMGKYPTNDNFDYDIPVIRYEEVILNYAEALLNLGDATNALTYLNMIPQHRNAATYTVANIDNILLERKKELCFEGFRFFDLARLGRNYPIYNSVGMLVETVQYGDFRYAFPIPNAEINANSNVVQNKGY